MKLSELKFDCLSDRNKYDLVMDGVKDYKKDNKVETDGIVVLGCAPRLLYDRILKMKELYDHKVSDNLFLTGGNGWHNVWQNDPRKQLYHAVIICELLGEKLFKYRVDNDKIKDIYVKQIIDVTEAELMKKYIEKIGGLEKAHKYYEPLAQNTRDNAIFTKLLINRLINNQEMDKCDSLAVITTAWHTRRTLAVFKKYFEDEEIKVYPSTEDIDRNGVNIDYDEYYRFYYDPINSECMKLITYSNFGAISDLPLDSFLSEEARYDIEKNQKDGIKTRSLKLKGDIKC